MSGLSFRNGTVLAADGRSTDAALSVNADGTIGAIASDATAPDAIDLDGGFLLPGFIDTQVNGGGGVLFNDTPDVATIARIGEAHRRFGTTAFLPTLISDTLDVIEAALDATDAAIDAGVDGCIGVHVEGPFLNPVRRGIHDKQHFRALDDRAIRLLTRPSRGKVMVTVAPEQNDLDAIRALVDAGVIVSLGHSDATYEQARQAIEAGARGVTHLFNAMSPLLHRAPGMVGAALEDETVYCGLIVDKIHVHPAAIRMALKTRPADRMMLVTDAMPSVGNGCQSFMLNGELIRVENGACFSADGTLAGCDLDMATAVANTVDIGVPIDVAAAMASANPAAFLGIGDLYGAIAVGKRADLVWLGRDLKIRGTWIGGRQVN
ncbi:N-acetylglucosamine-6-phosphate deacetylase [Sphingomonas sp. FW199]|uniref:N-acetylglucosamine-6-phosphate deacetylase n=1 Tax=Sphingomonas sp. FW199 TaxID=3400217 RepID=UPI003CEB0CD1